MAALQLYIFSGCGIKLKWGPFRSGRAEGLHCSLNLHTEEDKFGWRRSSEPASDCVT